MQNERRDLRKVEKKNEANENEYEKKNREKYNRNRDKYLTELLQFSFILCACKNETKTR